MQREAEQVAEGEADEGPREEVARGERLQAGPPRGRIGLAVVEAEPRPSEAPAGRLAILARIIQRGPNEGRADRAAGHARDGEEAPAQVDAAVVEDVAH